MSIYFHYYAKLPKSINRGCEDRSIGGLEDRNIGGLKVMGAYSTLLLAPVEGLGALWAPEKWG